ncbi:hypothetical protein FRUB_02155 [Fimbriiglobus ruber]|uniref:Uncharacterized protein n=1 Tax=Fimbriiglobus ruber TaxID=1908690 RepID=A0A225E218_9BACT|nr:hypothetical protein FRUB_02155 [Fimbriiglobus ruber]
MHAPSQRKKIEATWASYRVVSGLVSRQEFKRRVLKDAKYLIDQLDTKGGFEETFHYMNRLRTNKFHSRRASICISLMAGVTGESDGDKADRLRAKLHRLLTTGTAMFDAWLDRLVKESGCECGRANVRQVHRRDRLIYEVGPEECSKLPEGVCAVGKFSATQRERAKAVLDYLRALPDEKKTNELREIERYLADTESAPEMAGKHDPCLKVGDLLIALESAAAGAKTFYTMNSRESLHLCRVLGQTLIIRPIDGQAEDVICPGNDPGSWPPFK